LNKTKKIKQMNYTKEDILKALEAVSAPGSDKNLVESGSVNEVAVQDNVVAVEIATQNPSLQAKKKMEVEVMKAIHKGLDEKLDVKVNIKLKTVNVKPVSTQKGKSIPGVKNIIAVASGKGGVGKSTITANIAVSLSKMGFKVGILDSDVYGPSIPIMFDVATVKPTGVTVNGRSMIKPIESYGVKMLSLGFFTDPNQAVIWRGAMAAKALDQMLFDADWGELDFMLIDLPPGTGDIHLSIVQSVPVTGAVIVSTPQNIALADAKKGVSMFQQDDINVPVLGIVENMSYFIPEECSDKKYYIFGKDGAKNLGLDIDTAFLGEIPLVQSIRESGDVGRPVALQENSSLEEAFREVTKNMLTQLVKRNETLPPTEIVRITNMSGCSTQ
jgi:ATP-binding protein involved in chromosome partitioning